MKRLKWRRLIAMTATAVVVGGVCMGGPGALFAKGLTSEENQGIAAAVDVNLAADHSSLRFSELGALGRVFNEAMENKNSFGIDGSSETIPGLLTLFILAAGLLGIALMPRPYQWKHENMRRIKAQTLKDFRNSKRPSIGELSLKMKGVHYGIPFTA
jgi:hypothetical protein